MKIVEKILMGIANVLSVCSTIIVAAMMLLVVVDVLMRALFNSPITGSIEITQMMMTGMILGFAKSCLGNDNLKVDVVMERMPRNVQYVVDIVVSVISIGVCALLTWRSFENAMYFQEKNMVYVTLASVPKWIFALILTAGFGGGVVGLLLRIFKISREHKAELSAEEGGAN